MPSENAGYDLSIYSSRGNRHHNTSSLQLQPDASDLLSLPLELHYIILQYLDLKSLLALRKTSRTYFRIITVDQVRQLFIRHGRASPCLTACCNQCLSTPGLDRLVIDTSLDIHEWRSVCFRCWANRITQDYHLNPWPLIQIANGGEGYICQFCNWPVVHTGHDGDSGRLHAACRARRRLVLVLWFMMAFLQFGLGVICAVLAWTRYKRQVAIVIPSSIDFALAMLSVTVFGFRICTSNERTYARLLFVELILTVLRLPPVAYAAHTTIVFRLQAGLLPKFSFGIFFINL
ncbi:hypothetical protein F5Y17DRAFT_94846 [Xylariaceae sp. FL0594]|nr:hypothetical protein F5Y17DRAFT_94846 [Xylariaceae sp. FL0594]